MPTPKQTSGLIFPLVLSSGRHSVATGVELIHSSLKIILAWPLFTRFYESQFGSRIHEVIEEPNDDILINLMRTFVIDAISNWEKRVELLDLSIDRPAPEKLTVQVSYLLKELDIEDTFYYNYNL